LYFIVRVEVIEIQISFEFKFVCNLENSFEKEKGFSNFLRLLGRIPAQPSRPPPARVACAAQPICAMAQQSMGAHPRSEAESDPLSKSNPIAPNPTR
jgi:hypothetical protein